MKAVVQRVSGASVTVDGEIKGKIGKGFLVFLRVGKKDSELNAERLANKIIKNNKVNRIGIKVVGGILIIVGLLLLYFLLSGKLTLPLSK